MEASVKANCDASDQAKAFEAAQKICPDLSPQPAGSGANTYSIPLYTSLPYQSSPAPAGKITGTTSEPPLTITLTTTVHNSSLLYTATAQTDLSTIPMQTSTGVDTDKSTPTFPSMSAKNSSTTSNGLNTFGTPTTKATTTSAANSGADGEVGPVLGREFARIMALCLGVMAFVVVEL
jgi:hypothetical protein